jgi:cysteinyl-tRNA synthetase
MAAHRSTGKQPWRSTDTRSSCANDRTAERERREMSALQLCNTRPRATPTIVPADPSGRVGPFVCEPTVYDLPHLGHARAYTLRLPRPPPADPRLRRHVRAEHHRHGRQDRSLGARAADRRAELARMYERAYLDDMRALRNDSVDVYARASNYMDQVISQNERLSAGGRDAIRARGSTRNWSRLFSA